MNDLDLEKEAEREHKARMAAVEREHDLAIGRLVVRYLFATVCVLGLSISTCECAARDRAKTICGGAR